MAQENPEWDNPISNFPELCKVGMISSSLDSSIQPAVYYWSVSDNPRPLIVSFHTWSADYTQEDPLAIQCIQKDYHYIHPNFRGSNNKPIATGSKYVIGDIEDAISWACKNARIDTSEIHVIGVSGGGYASLLSYMKTKHNVKTFSAWVPISDLKNWFYESEGRKSKYALDVAKSTVQNEDFDSDYYYLGEEEAILRSPYYMETPVERRNNSKLYIYAGIHDGYEGSVPVSQSLLFFNKLVRDFDSTEIQSLIPEKDIIEILASRNFQGGEKDSIGDRIIHYQKTYKSLLKLTIFEGNHEMLTDVALDHIQTKRILCIGDSNGAFEEGWVNQLGRINFNNFIYNTSVSGNTIGFDNLDRQELNTLRNISVFLSEAEKNLGRITDIVIMLGTNDCKAVFEKKLKKVPQNYEKLIQEIKKSDVYNQHLPEIYIVSPPPISEDEFLAEKYKGGAARIASLQPAFNELARENNCTFIDIYSTLQPVWQEYTKDGIHLNSEGQKIIAEIINSNLK